MTDASVLRVAIGNWYLCFLAVLPIVFYLHLAPIPGLCLQGNILFDAMQILLLYYDVPVCPALGSAEEAGLVDRLFAYRAARLHRYLLLVRPCLL